MNQNKKNLYENHKTASVLKDVFLWIKDSLDINYPDQPVSDYSYLARADKVNEVCRIISAFGTGITDFELVDVPIEKVLNGLPKSLQDRIMSNIEQKKVEIRNSHQIKGIDMILRTRVELFIITIDASDAVKCQTIEFCHGRKNVLFDLGEESDGTIRILDLLEILLSAGVFYPAFYLNSCFLIKVIFLTLKFQPAFLFGTVFVYVIGFPFLSGKSCFCCRGYTKTAHYKNSHHKKEQIL